MKVLGDALELAEPGGHIRIFIDEGPSMAELLSEASARGIMPDYVAGLLAALEAEVQKSHRKSNQPSAIPDKHTEGYAERGAPIARGYRDDELLVEPLSLRELEILRLIAQGLSNLEIGERLNLAISTVKGHNRNIFAKLQVQRRTEAIARARELDLL